MFNFMKILLIIPPITIYKQYPTGSIPTYHMGLAYISSYLMSKGVEVRVLDALAEGFNEPSEDKI